jgi:hypothetical protein
LPLGGKVIKHIALVNVSKFLEAVTWRFRRHGGGTEPRPMAAAHREEAPKAEKARRGGNDRTNMLPIEAAV